MTSILIVDDIEIWRESLAQELSDTNYHVEMAEDSGKRAAKACGSCWRLRLRIDGSSAPRRRHGWPAGHEGDPREVPSDSHNSDDTIWRWAIEQRCDRGRAYRYIFRTSNIEACASDMRKLLESAERLTETEQKLKESFWTQQICSNTGMALGIVDRTYRILYENKAQHGISGGVSQPGGICWVEWHDALMQTEPCPWCPVKPVFAGEESATKTVPLVKEGELRYWQTGASPVTDARGHIIAALKWGLDVTDREHAHRAALEAPNLEARLLAALSQIRMWGYGRARLYELRPESPHKKVLSWSGDARREKAICLSHLFNGR